MSSFIWFSPTAYIKAARVITRRQQLELSSAKKGKKSNDKAEDDNDEDEEDVEPTKSIKKRPSARGKKVTKARRSPRKGFSRKRSKLAVMTMAKRRKTSMAESTAPEEANDDWEDEEPVPAKRVKAKSPAKVAAKAKAASGKSKAAPKAKSSASKVISKTAGKNAGKTRGKWKANGEEPGHEDMEHGDDDNGEEQPEAAANGGDEHESEGEADAGPATFARRYFPSRPYYQKKWLGIKKAYQDRVRVFITNHSKMEDPQKRAIIRMRLRIF